MRCSSFGKLFALKILSIILCEISCLKSVMKRKKSPFHSCPDEDENLLDLKG
jgi:hypothetical protein